MTEQPPQVAGTRERQAEMDARYERMIRRLEAVAARLAEAVGDVRGERVTK